MPRVIFLGGIFPDSMIAELESKSKGVIQYAANSLQNSFIYGLKFFFTDLEICNLMYIGSFPYRYKDWRIKSFSFFKFGLLCYNIGFINFPGIKLFFRYWNSFVFLKKIENLDTVIVYAVHTPFLASVVTLKKFYPDLKICLIVPDLPEFMDDSPNLIYKIFKKIENKVLINLLRKVDSFVVLTDHMVNKLNIGNRPWVRIEGIFHFDSEQILDVKESYKTILYTGTLARRYGIKNLLDAFSLILDDNYRLWICGDGDYRDEVLSFSKTDSRVTFFGQVSRETVLSLQKKATVLVNPRTSEGDFTKFSFPSKTMEYLASGTPCIINRLDGIPDEYYSYCFVTDDNSILALRDKIIYVCNLSLEELNEFGEIAKDFVLNQKNPNVQCKKVFDMLTNL